MSDRHTLLLGEVCGEAAGDLLDGGQFPSLGAFPLGAPPLHLTLDVALPLGEIAEADRIDVDRVQVGEDVDQIETSGPTVVDAEQCSLVGAVEHHAVDERHHVERRTVDLIVGAEPECGRDRHLGRADSGDDLVLTAHVVGRREHGTGRRAAQHVLGAVRARDRVGQIRASTHDGVELERSAGALDVVDEPGRHPVEVDAVNRFLHDGRP